MTIFLCYVFYLILGIIPNVKHNRDYVEIIDVKKLRFADHVMLHIAFMIIWHLWILILFRKVINNSKKTYKNDY